MDMMTSRKLANSGHNDDANYHNDTEIRLNNSVKNYTILYSLPGVSNHS
jgi:hypothetical protein